MTSSRYYFVIMLYVPGLINQFGLYQVELSRKYNTPVTVFSCTVKTSCNKYTNNVSFLFQVGTITRLKMGEQFPLRG